MKFKSLVGATVIALSSLGANAALTTTPFTSVTGSFSDTLLGSVNVPTHPWGSSDVAGGLGYVLGFVMFGQNFNLPAVTFSSVSLGGLSGSIGLNNTFSFLNVNAGSYDLKASGSVADGGTNWIGAQYTVTPVPEPETYAMLLAGLGLMGAIARRRNKAGSA